MAQIMDEGDLYELVGFLCNIDSEDDYEDDLDKLIYDKYEISLDSFRDIANDLIQLTPKIKLPITDTACHAFLDKDKSFILAKVKAE